MDFQNLVEIQTSNLTLKRISEQNRQFISDLFKDSDIRKYYIVPKEAQQDYRGLVDYWFKDMENKAGYAWVIYKKGTGLFSWDKPCGFFTFEFRGNIKNARISYAVAPKFRNQGIASVAADAIINQLKDYGVDTIEADIDQDNIPSEKLIQKLGFSADRRKALIDPEMMRDGDVRLRFLWRKKLFDYSQLDFHVVRNEALGRLFAPGTHFKVWEEEVSDGGGFSFLGSFGTRRATGRYHFLFQGNVTESLVGISPDDVKTYNVPWELIREEVVGLKRFMVFTGWGDGMSGGNYQFEGREIGIESEVIYNITMKLKNQSPINFSADVLNKVIGFERLQF